MSALVTNLYGGPGTGKSTVAALVFGKLKLAGVKAELVTEFAKDLTWEERHGALGFQPYVVGKQMFRIERVRDKVDVVVTDGPVLMGTVYGGDMPDSWGDFVHSVHRSWDTFDVFLSRPPTKVYDPSGRNQSQEEAIELDVRILDMLDQHAVDYRYVVTDLTEGAANQITREVLERLHPELRSSFDGSAEGAIQWAHDHFYDEV